MKNALLAVFGLLIAGAIGYWVVSKSPSSLTRPAAENGASKPAAERGEDKGRGRRGAPVEVAVARQGTSTDDLWSIGSLRSDESLQVASEVPGRIAEILFKEGEDVKAGDVLVKLDDALVRAEVEDAKARMTLAQSNYDRAQSLSKSGSGTERTLDESTSALEIAKAAVQLAETKLSKLSLTAPFPGRVGLRTMSVGAYATPGTPIVNLEKIDQLKLDFRVPETVLTQVSVDQDVELRVDALPGRTFPGKIYAIDPQVDVNGRSLHIRARVANPDLSLLPGLFARVIIKGLEERPVVRVAESAIVSRGQDKFVYSIVGGKAKENKVQLGRRRAGEVEILEGLEAGTQIITSGQMNLRDGAPVEIVSSPIQSARED